MAALEKADQRTEPSSEPHAKQTWLAWFGASLRGLFVVSFLAMFLGRHVAPALRGSAVGIERTIMLAERLGALTTQIAATVGLVLALRLVTRSITSARLSRLYRIFAAPLTLLIVALIALACVRPLYGPLHWALGIATTLLCLLVAQLGVKHAELRALAIVIGIFGSAGMAHIFARTLYIDTLESPRVLVLAAARGLETLAEIADLLALLLAALYVAARRYSRVVLLLFLATCGAVALFFVLYQPLRHDDAVARVFLARVFGELLKAPHSFFPVALRYGIEIFATLLALWSAFARGTRARVAVGLSLALLSRSSLDMPLPALLLSVTALWLAALSDDDLHGLYGTEYQLPKSPQPARKSANSQRHTDVLRASTQ